MSSLPYVISERKVRFYNAGDRIQVPLLYSNPDGHDIHVLCRYNLDAPAGGEFRVPEVIQVGMAQVHVNFAADISRDFGDRGVILIDANYEPPHRYEPIFDDQGEPTGRHTDLGIDTEADDRLPIAASIEEAKRKGVTMWRAYIETKVRSHMEQCEQIRAAGGVPIAASGQMKRWLKLAGYSDPAEAMLLESKRQTSALEAIREQGKKDGDEKDERIARLEALVEQLVNDKTANKPEPEMAGAKKK